MRSEDALGAAGLPGIYQGPGLVDLQLNGYASIDFNADVESCQPDLFAKARDALNRRGVIVALPTFITDDAARMIKRAKAFGSALARRPELEKSFPGIHIEGPFISNEDGPRGARVKAFCRSPRALPNFFDQLREASGDRIRILTLAPELPGALELISKTSRAGTAWRSDIHSPCRIAARSRPCHMYRRAVSGTGRAVIY